MPGTAPLVYVPPGRNHLEQALRWVEQDMDSRGWDGPTGLYWLSQLPTNPNVAGPGRELLGVSHPEMSDALGRISPLQLLATLIRLLPASEPPASAGQGFFGIVVVFEVWELAFYPDVPGALQEAMSHEGRVAQHPQRIEARHALLVSRHGHLMALRRQRDQEPEVMTELAGVYGDVAQAAALLVAHVSALP